MTNRETLRMAQAYLTAKNLPCGRMKAVAFNGARTDGETCRRFDVRIDSDVDEIIDSFPQSWHLLTELEIDGWQDPVHLGQRNVLHHSGAQKIFDAWEAAQ